MRRSRLVILTLVLPATGLAQPLCGDCSENGVQDILDALVAAQIGVSLITPNPFQVWACDVDLDFSIDVLDALLMAQNAAGIPVTIDCNTLPLIQSCVNQPPGDEERFLYTAPDGTSDVPGFSVDPLTGILTPLPGSPFNRGATPGGLTTNTNGIEQCNGFLYVANRSADSVTGFAVDPVTGALTPLPGSPYPTGGVNATSLACDEARSLIAVTGYSSNFVVMVQDPGTGILTAGGPPISLSSALGVDWDLTTGRLYVSNGSSIAGYDVSLAGLPTPIPGSPWPSGGFIHAIEVHEAGGLLFADNMNTGVVVHDIQPTGALTAHPGSPFMVPLVETLSLALDEANDRMVVGCRCSGGVVCLLNGVNSGNLVYVQDIPTGANQPICLDIFNDRLYVTHEGGPVGVIDLPPGGPYIAVPGSPFTPVGSMSGVSSHWLYRATGLAPGLIQIDYEVDDAESDPLTLTAEFSTDGVSFAPATMGPGSDPMSGIVTVAGTPQAYFFVWDAAIDLGPGGSPTAHVRLTPADSVGSGAPCTVGPFAVP